MGEVPPYLMSYSAAKAGKDQRDLLGDSEEQEQGQQVRRGAGRFIVCRLFVGRSAQALLRPALQTFSTENTERKGKCMGVEMGRQRGARAGAVVEEAGGQCVLAFTAATKPFRTTCMP